MEKNTDIFYVEEIYYILGTLKKEGMQMTVHICGEQYKLLFQIFFKLLFRKIIGL